MPIARTDELTILNAALRTANSLRLERFHEQTAGWPIMCGVSDYLRDEVREAELSKVEVFAGMEE